MGLKKKVYCDCQTVISAQNLNDIQDAVIGLENREGEKVTANYAHSAFANAIKGTATGPSVLITTSSPLEHNINVKLSGAAKLYRAGKNLLPYPYHGRTNGQHTGFTFTDNGDGSITVNGQQNGAGNAYFDLMFERTLLFRKGSYMLSGTNGIDVQYVTSKGTYLTFSKPLNEDTEIIRILLTIPQSSTKIYDNVTVKPMLEKGTIATEYEPYVEPEECQVGEDGTATVRSLYPSTRLYTDTEGVTITAKYNKDTNRVINGLLERISALEAAALNNV